MKICLSKNINVCNFETTKPIRNSGSIANFEFKPENSKMEKNSYEFKNYC